ncbi:TMEM165/GDT1 family protein [Leptolyngbyaceae cyanobacterium CCMR0082]|uniref:GDT1 family protein n=1 Tax=Adonisia turfae CCMR0082 TaxID=2304604 RepID=A0A6M0S0R3_9CYAN|nr:TMEM165/GDT1 family protein [Adonisia turfae]MDV3349013.1 TMEM165/GDT1 family protein [Leptothoe sp. LEGE 181152]NEZ62038.1 TMEM165/GDT1 family protein [Adonisia turfae CCMR0082]
MLAAFTASLLLITISELGDKTFFIAAILAMRHRRRWVFAGAVGALALMTILSVLVGQAASLLPDSVVKWAEVCLFIVFGIRLLYQASQMATTGDEEKDAAEAVDRAEKSKRKPKETPLAIMAETFGLVFVAEWGDRTQIATIALAAANPPGGVVMGAVLGHAICAAIATNCGRWLCGRVSERTLTALGGGLFLLFGSLALFMPQA